MSGAAASAEQPMPAAASVFAVELFGEFVRRGIADVVVCPGSRSQALALAAAAAEQAGAIRLHVHIDERSAAFFALGVARETGMPAPVIVTSGTAVPNLYPAMLEAHEARVPFIALTADRPAELRGIRSNQTTAQAALLGAAARLSLDVPAPEWGSDGDLVRDDVRDPAALAEVALARALGAPGAAPAGPVQLNLAFREPLSGTSGFEAMIAQGFAAAKAEADTLVKRADAPLPVFAPDEVYELGAAGAEQVPTVVIAGAEAGGAAEEFAHMAGLPLLAEVVSGSRFGREAVVSYSRLLARSSASGLTADPQLEPSLGDRVRRAIVFGHPTLTRPVPALLQRDDVEVVVVDPHAGQRTEHYNPGRRARVVRAARIAVGYDPRAVRNWLDEWLTADAELLAADLRAEGSKAEQSSADLSAEQSGAEQPGMAGADGAAPAEPLTGAALTRAALARLVWNATAPADRLVVAASRLVRVLDRVAQARNVRVHANRGLAGIDGTIATALGIAATSQADPANSRSTTRLLIGDIATLHDAGSLLLREGESRPRIQVVVGNDGGGTIFDDLEVAGSADRDAYARVMRTPQRVDLAALARAYGWEYARAETAQQLAELLAADPAGPSLIEAPLGDE